MKNTLDELYSILYSDFIELKDEYGQIEKTIYKNQFNFTSSQNYLISNYATNYHLDNDELHHIKIILNRFIWLDTIVKVQNGFNLNLEEEAKKIYKAISIMQDSKIFKNDEPNYDDCYMTIIKRYKKIADDLIELQKEKIYVNPHKNIDDELMDNTYIYTVISKYKNLNPFIILSAFKQSKKILATELFFELKQYILLAKDIQNDKSTKISENTIKLIKELFDIKINNRDIANTNEYLSITRYFLNIAI